MVIKNTLLGGTDNVNGDIIDADDVNDTNDALAKQVTLLGEVRMFALSISGAVTKATLQARGWAIMDGTDIVTTQGITGATITGNAPDIQDRFIKMSNDETSGTTGGNNTDHNHQWAVNVSQSGQYGINTDNVGGTATFSRTFDSAGSQASFTENTGVNKLNTNAYTTKANSEPAYYELAFFMRVK